jgi:hypothetical protein
MIFVIQFTRIFKIDFIYQIKGWCDPSAKRTVDDPFTCIMLPSMKRALCEEGSQGYSRFLFSLLSDVISVPFKPTQITTTQPLNCHVETV